MIEFIRQWVINIVTFVLFIVMFEMLLPTGKMKKYISLVTGTLLVIAIISPLVDLAGKNIDFTALQTSNSNYLDRLQVEKDSKLLEEEQAKQIVEVYRQKIIGQLEQNAREIDGVKEAKADIIFNEDYNSQTFGEIRRAYLQITTVEGDAAEADSSAAAEGGPSGGGDGEGDGSKGDGSAEAKAVARVERVKVGEVKKTQAEEENCDPALRKRLEERISQVFGVKSENIIISQMKR